MHSNAAEHGREGAKKRDRISLSLPYTNTVVNTRIGSQLLPEESKTLSVYFCFCRLKSYIAQHLLNVNIKIQKICLHQQSSDF